MTVQELIDQLQAALRSGELRPTTLVHVYAPDGPYAVTGVGTSEDDLARGYDRALVFTEELPDDQACPDLNDLAHQIVDKLPARLHKNDLLKPLFDAADRGDLAEMYKWVMTRTTGKMQEDCTRLLPNPIPTAGE